ncbi:MAG: N-acetylneuraminate synthase family protein [Alphaproteobacteria bacterium]|jgi:N-acetylneuraminate synthase/N,N'-diacetyllegionaminate synthase|nr:N-acetylneuraminate synthase family protein [Alphaproteobacteria bacterium]
MKLFGKNLEHDVAVVAEVGVNHEGDVEAASALLRLAAEAGADAVKFQTYSPDRYATASDTERLTRVGRFALDEGSHGRLAKEAKSLGIVFFSTAVTEDVVPLLDSLCPVIKIASGDLTFEPVVRAAAATGKSVILSTGGGTVDEIDCAVDWVRGEIGDAALADRLVLMQCVSAYPTPIEQANARSVPFLAERYGVHVGYSNHVIGIEACLAAIALGASVIEAHFTDRKSGRDFRDHQLSFEPDDMADLVRRAPLVKASLGAYGKAVQPVELPGRDIMRKGVVAARDLAAGTALAETDLMYARPATEFAAADLPRLVGRHLLAAVGRGELIRRENVESA